MSHPIAGPEPGAGQPPLYRGKGGVWSPSGFSWALFEFARNPYFLLVVTFVFPTYFATKEVGDPVEGQVLVASATRIAGIICALTAPLLGAMMDRGGRRKPLMAFFLGSMAVAAFALYWSEPKGHGGLGIDGTILFLVIAFVAYTYSEVMHNAMLSISGRREVLPHISGAGLGLGNGAGMLCLLLWAFLLLSRDKLGIPKDTQVERWVGPAMAVWLCVFVAPFFLFMPDGAPRGGTWLNAAKDLFRAEDGKVKIAGTTQRFVKHIGSLFKEFPEVMTYLVARIAFADALTTLLALGGVYTAGVLRWSPLEVGLYGIYGTFFAATGAFLGGVLDSKIGPRKAIAFELIVIIVTVIAMLSITSESIFFGLVPSSHAVWGSPYFASLSSVSYLGFVAIASLAMGACLSSSRYMLVAIAPAHRISEFFGLYALSATVTVWAGPLLVETVTAATRDQRWGMSTVLILLFIGFGLFVSLKVEPAKKAA